MLTGAHAIIYSPHPEADRAFLRDVLGLPHVDVGDGWLIFGLPPAEVAVHPTDGPGSHELYLLCDDVDAFVAAMGERGVACEPVSHQAWGALTQVSLPGGGRLGVYQPTHARPAPVKVAKSKGKKKAAGKKADKKKAAGKKADKKKAAGKKADMKATKAEMKASGKKAARKAAKAEKKAARKLAKAAPEAAEPAG